MSTKERYSREIEDAIGKARFSRSRTAVTVADGSEVYAYPHSRKALAWGVNAAETGVNILRGVRRPDGTEPEEHKKAADDLRDLADLSTKPNEKRGR